MDKYPWTRKYAPKSQKEVQGQDSVLEQLNTFLLKYTSQSKKGLILYGKSGIGKTSSVYAVAKDQDLEVLEVNASDFRNKASIIQVVGGAVQQRSLFAKGKIILIDEIDGLSGNSDRGGIAALSSFIKYSSYPLIMTANNPFDKKFKDLRKASEMVPMNTPSHLSVCTVLKRIAEKEKIKVDESALKSLARRCGGDIRAAINDMQSIASDGSIDQAKVDSLSEREHKDSIHEALMRIMKTTDPFVAKQALAACDETWDTFMLWLDENLPKEYKGADLARAYDILSRVDVYNGRIRRHQYYRFLAYINDLLSAGIATAKDEKYKGFVKYERPKRLLSMYIAKMRFSKRNSIADKLSVPMHLSKKGVIQKFIPYLKQMARNKEMAAGISKEFELDRDEMEWLKTH